MSAAEAQYFVFDDAENYESISRYTLGGLCPIQLGSILGPSPQYRIVGKLGHGAFSTVWLAHDRVARQNVALKIVQANQTSSNNQEAAILRRLRAPSSKVVQLLDVFEHTSANGVHQVLVTEPVHPLDYMRYSKFQPKITRHAIWQLMKGLAFIHSQGIAHGDLHPGNFGIAIPELHAFSDTQIWEYIGRPYTLPIVHSTLPPTPDAFPAYICGDMDLGKMLLHHAPEVAQRPLEIRILDFGNAYVVGESLPPRCVTPMTYAAPEAAFMQEVFNDLDAPWDQRSDIWSLAVCIHALVSSRGLFQTYMGEGILHDMMHYAGEVPDAWRRYFKKHPFPKGKPFPSPVHASALWAEKERLFAACGVEDPAALVRMLRRMMVLDPARRPTAGELLCDAYFAGM